MVAAGAEEEVPEPPEEMVQARAGVAVEETVAVTVAAVEVTTSTVDSPGTRLPPLLSSTTRWAPSAR